MASSDSTSPNVFGPGAIVILTNPFNFSQIDPTGSRSTLTRNIHELDQSFLSFDPSLPEITSKKLSENQIAGTITVTYNWRSDSYRINVKDIFTKIQSPRSHFVKSIDIGNNEVIFTLVDCNASIVLTTNEPVSNTQPQSDEDYENQEPGRKRKRVKT